MILKRILIINHICIFDRVDDQILERRVSLVHGKSTHKFNYTTLIITIIIIFNSWIPFINIFVSWMSYCELKKMYLILFCYVDSKK